MFVALHNYSVPLNISVIFIFVLIVAQVSSGIRFPKGFKRISFSVGLVVVEVKYSISRMLRVRRNNFYSLMLMFLQEIPLN